ncbi:MAG: zinc ribbon domain-containing protein [Spirochaetales bacterium]|jgi:hypothetical protein|nr:zinc ribbon domain-containing protein [Thermoplasmata archaeon]MBR6084752.1 zinc ribbon domain-containing protein [Spirochaetales bacterium]MBR6214675.1 zinc ribbon domain-containing protein [Candidatus Methanomethylophilaceae archaeon]
MKCSKCGFDNPEDALFCEKCDWKLGETYIPEVKINRSVFSYVALIVGIIAIIPALMKTAVIASVILGGVGLVLGGYSFNIPRLTGASNKNILMAFSGIGLILSVTAFIYGIYLLVN